MRDGHSCHGGCVLHVICVKVTHTVSVQPGAIARSSYKMLLLLTDDDDDGSKITFSSLVY